MKERRLHLIIEGMHCSSCAMNIDFELEDIPGVMKAQTHYGKQISTIEYDSEKISEKDIIHLIEKLGYKAHI